MSERNAVQRAFDRFGKESGFEKKSGSWYGRTAEVISVSNLQKSQYGPKYYFNQAFGLRDLGDNRFGKDERFPKDTQCHIRTRLECLLPDSKVRITQLLDLDYPMPDEQRIEELADLLKTNLLPMIREGGSLAGLGAMEHRGVFENTLMGVPAREALRAAFARR